MSGRRLMSSNVCGSLAERQSTISWGVAAWAPVSALPAALGNLIADGPCDARASVTPGV